MYRCTAGRTVTSCRLPPRRPCTRCTDTGASPLGAQHPADARGPALVPGPAWLKPTPSEMLLLGCRPGSDVLASPSPAGSLRSQDPAEAAMDVDMRIGGLIVLPPTPSELLLDLNRRGSRRSAASSRSPSKSPGILRKPQSPNARGFADFAADVAQADYVRRQLALASSMLAEDLKEASVRQTGNSRPPSKAAASAKKLGTPSRVEPEWYYADSPLLASHLMTPSEVSMVRLGTSGYLGAPV